MFEDKIIERLDSIESVLERHGQNLKSIESVLERQTERLIDHDDYLKSLREDTITRDEFRTFAEGQDEMITILKRLDEERIFTANWIKRVEEKVEIQEKELEKQKKELQRIKLELKIA